MSRSTTPTVPSVLRAGVLAAAAVLLSWSLTVPSGVLAAGLGGLAGALGADLVARRQPRLRLAAVVVVALVGLLVGVWIARLAVRASWIAALLGPVAAVWLSEAVLWLSLVGSVVFAVRFTARRRPLLNLLEVLGVASAMVAGFAAHRDGMVHRPLLIGDWAWSRGFDPVIVFLILGGLGAAVLAALLVREERGQRLPLHFAALAVVALVLLLVVRVGGLPKPEPAGDLGLTGEAEEGDQERQGQAGGGGGGDNDQLDDLQFKNEYGDAGSEAPVAVVVLHDDYSPPSGVYYFRQSVFSQYNGHKLVRATRDDVDRDVVDRFPFEPMTVAEAPPLSRERMMLRTTMGLLVDHVRPFALDSPVLFQPTRNPNPMRFQRAFEARSHVQTVPYQNLVGRRPGNPEWDDEQWRHYTETPSDPRYRDLGERLVRDLRPEYASDPLAQALMIKEFLDEQGIYSRRSRHAGDGDPTASFLFGDLTGYCVHFAHAATYLLRSRGLPARVAAGYAVAESDRAGGSAVMIRGLNAHAWPELYLDGLGWVVVDLAPQTTLDETAPSPDQTLQRMLGEMMRQQPGDEPMLGDEARSQPWRTLLRWLLAALAVAIAAAYLAKIYRALAPRLLGPRHVFRVGYRAALDRLAEVGLRRRRGESRESFADRLDALSPAFRRLTAQHLGWALGSRRLAPARAVRDLLSAVESDVSRRTPIWRQVVGWINPFSWMTAR